MQVRQAFIAADLTARKDDPDTGYDLCVEVPASEAHGEFRFLVQVKTSANQPIRADGSWRILVKKTAIQKYLRSRHPVFLFAVDLKTNEIRWIDLLNNLSSNREQTSFLLGKGNCWEPDNPTPFRAALEKAVAALDQRYAAPAKVLARKCAGYEQIDPRISVRADLINGVEHYTLSAKENVAFKMQLRFSSDSERNAWTEAVTYGGELSIQPEEISVEGSPLFQTIKPNTISIQSEKRRTQFRLYDPTKQSDSTYFGEPNIDLIGAAMHGNGGVQLLIDDDDWPFTMRVRHAFGQPSAVITITNDYDRWAHNLFSDIPNLKRTLRLFESLSSAKILGVAAYLKGEFRQLFTCKLTDEVVGHLKEYIEFQQALLTASTVAKYIQSNLRLPKQLRMSRAEADALKLIERAITDGFVNVENCSISFEKNKDLNTDLLSTREKLILVAPFTPQIGGEILGTIYLSVECTNCIVEQDHDNDSVKIDADSIGNIRVAIASQEQIRATASS